jgi:glucose/arabinose dehydrogenase
MKLLDLQLSAALFVGFTQTAAAACSPALKSSYPTPIVSDGWQAQLIVQGLSKPRSILFDSNGGLLVVQQGAGIVHLEFTDSGSACLEVAKKTYLINSTAVSIATVALADDHPLIWAVKSRYRALERWKDLLRLVVRRGLLVVLRCESGDGGRYESDTGYGHEQ